MESKVHKCKCGKVYSFKQGLSKHRKICSFEQKQTNLFTGVNVQLQLQELEHKYQMQIKDIEHKYQLQIQELEHRLQIT